MRISPPLPFSNGWLAAQLVVVTIKPPSKKPNLDGADGAQGNEEATVKTEEDAEVMSGNLSVEVVEKIASKHVKNTYAGATSKPKVDMKNLVYVQKGRERRAPIQGTFHGLYVSNALQYVESSRC